VDDLTLDGVLEDEWAIYLIFLVVINMNRKILVGLITILMAIVIIFTVCVAIITYFKKGG
jgi:hypothetical protein